MKIVNKEALFEYEILEKLEAGIKLIGPEVKSVKGGHVSLKGSFVRIIGSEAYLVNAQIYPYPFANVENYDPRRTRKLLLNKKETLYLKGKTDGAALTLAPLTLYLSHGLVKLEIGLARGKKQYEKRDTLKKRAEKRELERFYRGKVR